MAIRAIGANVNSVTFGKNEKTDKVLARKSTGSAMQEGAQTVAKKASLWKTLKVLLGFAVAGSAATSCITEIVQEGNQTKPATEQLYNKTTKQIFDAWMDSLNIARGGKLEQIKYDQKVIGEINDFYITGVSPNEDTIYKKNILTTPDDSYNVTLEGNIYKLDNNPKSDDELRLVWQDTKFQGAPLPAEISIRGEYGFKNGELLEAYKAGDTFDVAIRQTSKPDSLIIKGLKDNGANVIKIFSKTVNGSQIVF